MQEIHPPMLLKNLNIPNKNSNRKCNRFKISRVLPSTWIFMISLMMASSKLVNRVLIQMISYQQMKTKVYLALSIRIIIRILKSKIINIIWIYRNPWILLRCGRHRPTIMKKQTMSSRSFKVLQWIRQDS